MPSSDGVQVEVTYYTDPLCSWSWAFEPQWRRLRYEFGPQLTWRYRLAGMIPDWNTFSDPLNSVSRPLHLGPQWFQVQQISGMPIDDRIWIDDPPASSYPACIAVKAAEFQGPAAGERYLRRVREAVMLERRNVARWNVLLALADELAVDTGAVGVIDRARFGHDLASEAAREAFRNDLKDARYRDIGRFPTLMLRRMDGPGIILTGYRPYQALLDAVIQIAPRLERLRIAQDSIAYAAAWDSVLSREVAEALDLEADAATAALDAAASDGLLVRERVRPDAETAYYRPPLASGPRP